MKDYVKNPQKNVMLPAFARGRHVFVEERMQKLTEWAETAAINRIEWGGKKIGVITAGSCYQYAREALGEDASYLKLGMVNPLPVKLIQDFAAQVETVYVIEELDDILETHCVKNGVKVIGKELFPRCGEFSQNLIRKLMKGETPESVSLDLETPPVLQYSGFVMD